MIITLAQFDIERTAVHDNLRLATSSPCDKCSNSCSAGTCTTGLGDAAATLPDTGADGSIVFHARKFDIAALWEGWMMFKDASCLAYLIHIVGKDDVVGIAH